MNGKLGIISLAAVLFAVGGALLPSRGAINDGMAVLEFDTMVGVDGPLRGNLNSIRGIPGGGAPWVLDAAMGSLKADGRLEIMVVGLIIPVRPGFEDRGFNPAPFFRAIVSCMTVDQFGAVVVENIMTNPEDTEMIGDPRNGDARINATLMLPNPCLAPVIFVTSPTGSWFAVTGSGMVPEG